jgi:transglutaminase/protease-like cytokinesis protein 3
MQLNSGPSPIEQEKERDFICLYHYIATNISLIKQSFHKEKPNKKGKTMHHT